MGKNEREKGVQSKTDILREGEEKIFSEVWGRAVWFSEQYEEPLHIGGHR
jgi:hypothetical protein